MIKKFHHISNILARRVQTYVDCWAAHYWHNNPFGDIIRAPEQAYLDLWMVEKSATYPEIVQFEAETGFSIDPDWFHDLALHTQVVIKNSPICYQHGRVLYSALRRYLKNTSPQDTINIFETGTARGFSSVVMARALADANAPGKIITFDVLPHRAKMYWNCIDDHKGRQSRAELLAPWADLVLPSIIFVEGCSRINLKKMQTGRIHFAFLDGGHGYKDASYEFETVAARQQSGDIIVFDDYNPALFPGVVQAVDEGCKKWNYNPIIIPGRDNRGYVVAQKK